MKNAYFILGLRSASCTDDEIRAAYRKAAAIHHPDAGGTQASFQVVQEAYDALRTPSARKAYDAAMSQRIVECIAESCARIVSEFFEACDPRESEKTNRL